MAAVGLLLMVIRSICFKEWASVVKGKGIKWINVRAASDSNVKDEYGIYGIPANFLIDCATGKIVASGLRGNALKEKLTELFDNI